jgi:hypothetical protein
VEEGRTCTDAGDVAGAEAAYRSAADLDPEWSVPFYNLGLLCKYQWRWVGSLEGHVVVKLLSASTEADAVARKRSFLCLQGLRDRRRRPRVHRDGVRRGREAARRLESPKTAVEQAHAIAKESGRYNLGIPRTGNSPLLPLRILRPATASGFRFTLTGTSLAFAEFRTPSLLRRRTDQEETNLLTHGTFEMDVATGRVLAAELTADGPPPAHSLSMSVRYREDPQLQLLVPLEATERYWRADRPRDDRPEATSTYTNFRRFQVTVDETIKVPK